ncbi:type I-F CRISPR-associated endoribonuclease Cas6/Csy4 [Candidatus Magnetaquicoccus inordinatus]|uniref:type I-F CRISPR-associated endoribonuclease Cas6/Csy4 n=1 Tax=Candidatus Magnetaquicoccus inordinatus TaxID=2496818 RepID=UPI00102B9058|nr:type I-F CRISPR-associated endoribonuclease Cas6/Csy4 [Candidatus Magnetaquicoccus inordinatus]
MMLIEGYLTAKALPGTGLDSAFLFSKVLMQVRNAGLGAYALSFPQAQEGGSSAIVAARNRPTLGDILQIFAAQEVIEGAVRLLNGRFADYLEEMRYRPLRGVMAQQLCFRRLRDEERRPATIARELRRTMRRIEAGKRSSLSAEELRERQRSVRTSDAPYLMVFSHSTQQSFNIPFRKEVITAAPVQGVFDSYGFSKEGATVPFIP